MRIVEWSIIKQFIDDSGASFKSLDLGNDYEIIAKDDWFGLKCFISKTSPANSDQTDFETNYLPNEETVLSTPKIQSPFAAKTVGNKKLYTRTHGSTFSLTLGANDCDFVIPYPQVKFNAIEVVGCELGDKIELQILDSDTGLLTTVPNYMLNQFGFSVGLPKDFYVRESKYDADLYGTMQIRVKYDSASAKDVTINYVLHELK